MSEIKVNKVSPATGTAITLGDSGDTFTVPSGATIVNSGTATGFGGGKVLQVVGTTKTDQFSTTSTSIVTAFSATITPSASSSKVLVMGHFCMSSTQDANTPHLYRDTTEICLGDASGSRTRGLLGSVKYDQTRGRQVTFSFLDSPNSTSALVYAIKVASNGAGQQIVVGGTPAGANDVWDGTGTATMNLMEISA